MFRVLHLKECRTLKILEIKYTPAADDVEVRRELRETLRNLMIVSADPVDTAKSRK